MKGTLQPTTASAEQPLRDDDRPRETPEFLTQIQICRRLGITDETWRRWRAAGKTPAPLDLPGHPRWRAADIERFLQGRKADPKTRTYFASVRQYRHR
jgi:hypothetical protein